MNSKFKKLVLSALFAALTAAGCFIIIPLPGGIPIVIQDMMAMLSGLVLGPLYGTISVAVFLVLGAIGLPVFSGKAGLHVLTSGPSCGFLIGYMVGAFVGGMMLSILLKRDEEHSNSRQYVSIFIAALAATVTVFLLGILGFMHVTGKSFTESIPFIVLPFIPGNTIKLVLMVFLTKKLRRTVMLG